MTLTREEILAMEPGVKLDREIAKFMGVNENMFRFAHGAGNFNYSTDISAAWEVVEKMRETHIYELADFGRNTYKKAQHFATFHSLDRPRDYERQVRAKKLP